MKQVIEINTDSMIPPAVGADLFSNRAAVAEMQRPSTAAEVSIIIQAYNRLEKTKRCVESVIKYTGGVDYELILLDNGSEDGTLEYFESIEYTKKTILHITQNLGASYPTSTVKLSDLGRFICFLPSDLIVTAHWLENLLICMKSDDRIGMVNPVCSNTSNLQCVELSYTTYAEMQKEAERFNRSDPKKWEDRLRLITLGTLYRKEAVGAIGWPIGDVGFFHDFGDDDVTFRIRRMGYRTVLAGDTWVCHDHKYQHGEGKDPVEFKKSIDIGRANFRDKYYGVDAWEDVNNFYIPYLSYFPAPKRNGLIRILGIDTRCGTPILDIKNWLCRAGIFDAELSAFTQDAKYWLDLKTICKGPVICDREEFLTDPFLRESFDYIVVDRPLNRYHEPQKIINDLFALCKKGGVIVCRLKNTFSFQSYLHQLGQRDVYDPEFAYHMPLEVVENALERKGKIEAIVSDPYRLAAGERQALAALLPAEIPGNQQEDLVNHMVCNEYLLIVEKNT